MPDRRRPYFYFLFPFSFSLFFHFYFRANSLRLYKGSINTFDLAPLQNRGKAMRSYSVTRSICNCKSIDPRVLSRGEKSARASIVVLTFTNDFFPFLLILRSSSARSLPTEDRRALSFRVFGASIDRRSLARSNRRRSCVILA